MARNETKIWKPSYLEDDNDDEMVGRILTRREVIGMFGATSLAALLIGCGTGSSTVSGTTSGTGTSTGTNTGTGTGTGTSTGTGTGSGTGVTGLVVTPQVTEGPFFVDEKLNRSDLVTPGSSRSTVSGGVPLTLNLTVYGLSGTVGNLLSGAFVDLWHCDTIGAYSDIVSGSIQNENTRGQNWLRGYQVTDASGQVTFQTIIPGWYTGRTLHFHFKVRTYDSSGNQTHEFTSQLFTTDAFSTTIYQNSIYNHGTRTVFNSNDNIFSARQSDGTTVGSVLTLNPSQSGSGYSAAFTVAFAV